MCPLSAFQSVAVPVVFYALDRQPLRMGVIRAGVPWRFILLCSWVSEFKFLHLPSVGRTRDRSIFIVPVFSFVKRVGLIVEEKMS